MNPTAQLDLTQKALDRYAESIAGLPHRKKATEIPTGATVSIAGCVSSGTIEPCLDLDSGRRPALPENLRKTSLKDSPSPELLAWAEKAGVDLLRIEIRRPGDDEAYYGYKPVGMKVWRIDDTLYRNLANELRKGKKLDLPTPWQGVIASTDDKHTACFLFITREGACGAMKIRSEMVSRSTDGYSGYGAAAFEFEFICEREPGKPAVKPDKPARARDSKAVQSHRHVDCRRLAARTGARISCDQCQDERASAQGEPQDWFLGCGKRSA